MIPIFIFSLITAYISYKKGRNVLMGWLYGWVLGVLGIAICLCQTSIAIKSDEQ